MLQVASVRIYVTGQGEMVWFTRYSYARQAFRVQVTEERVSLMLMCLSHTCRQSATTCPNSSQFCHIPTSPYFAEHSYFPVFLITPPFRNGSHLVGSTVPLATPHSPTWLLPPDHPCSLPFCMFFLDGIFQLLLLPRHDR